MNVNQTTTSLEIKLGAVPNLGHGVDLSLDVKVSFDGKL